MRYVITVVKAILLVIIVLFCVFNTQTISLALFPNRLEYTMPLFLPILIGVLAGVFLAGVFMYADRWKMSGELKRTQKQLSSLQSEVQRLHNLPLTDKDGEA